jgi:hypothetical protein
MEQATIIGIDLAKRVFQAHGAAADGSVVFRKKLSRSQFLTFLAAQPRSTVAMEACATAHGWGREISSRTSSDESPITRSRVWTSCCPGVTLPWQRNRQPLH